MTDSATTGLKMRDQEDGTNQFLWGGYTDTNLAIVDRSITGVETIAVSGDATITYTDYVATNNFMTALSILTGPSGAGTLSAAATITVPNVLGAYRVYNITGKTITIGTAAGTSVDIPTGYLGFLFNDGTDVKSYPLFVNGAVYATAGSANNNLTTVAQVSALIAAASISGTGNTFKVSADDTTSKYAEDAITAGTGIDISVNNPGANENLQIDVDTTELEEFLALSGKITSSLSSGTTALTARRRYRFTGTATGTLPTMAAGDFVILEFANAAGTTATVGRNSQTIDGTAADDTFSGEPTPYPVIRYDYSSAGAVVSELIGSKAS